MLTSRQRDALIFIEDYQREQGRSPTYPEIADGLSISSKSGVHRLVTGLEERGFLARAHQHGNHVPCLIVLRTVTGGKTPPHSYGLVPVYDASTHQIRGWVR
jgi:repressor LexA